MERCEKYMEQISAYLDDELDYQEEIELFIHLEACPSCRQMMDVYRFATAQVHSEWEVDPPPDLAQNVMAQITARPLVLQSASSRGRGKRRFAAVAAIFAVVTLVGLSGMWSGIIPGGEFLPGEWSAPDHFQMTAPAAAPPLGAAAEAPSAEVADWAGERSGPLGEEAYGEEEDRLEMVDGQVIAALEDIFEEPGALAGTALLEKFLSWNDWNWNALVRDLERSGFSYELSDGTFVVLDFQNPGSYLYGVLREDADSPGEVVVVLMGYRFRVDDIDRRVEIRAGDRGKLYYYAVPRVAEGGASTDSRNRLWDFVITS